MERKGRLAPCQAPRNQDLEDSWRNYDRIEPGEYSAYCRSAKVYCDSHFGRWVCALQFNVLDDSHFNVIAAITCFLNLEVVGEKPRATSRRSRYWQAWIAANGGRPPARGGIVWRPRSLYVASPGVEVVDVEKDSPSDGGVMRARSTPKWSAFFLRETGNVPGSTTNKPPTNIGIREKGC